MTNLKLSFLRDEIFELTNDQFTQLSLTGETVTDFIPAKNYQIDDEVFTVLLSFDGSLSDYFFEFEPEDDINIFINHSYITHFFPKTGKVKLIKGLELSLNDLLKKSQANDNITTIQKNEFIKQRDLFDDGLLEDSVIKLTTTGNFKGQISCCACGEAGCKSEYLWAENYIGLISFKLLAGGLQLVTLYPFKLV